MPKGIYDHSKRDYSKVWKTRLENDPNNEWYKKCLETKIKNGNNKRSKESNQKTVDTRRKNGTYKMIWGDKIWETRHKNDPNNLKCKMSKETKEKLRKYKIDKILQEGCWFTIGKNEKQLLDEQEIKDNCKILRQYIVRVSHTQFYSVDGYCKETNTVYEVYEKAHDKKVFKDLERQNEICKYLSCTFIVIYDKNSEKVFETNVCDFT